MPSMTGKFWTVDAGSSMYSEVDSHVVRSVLGDIAGGISRGEEIFCPTLKSCFVEENETHLP